MVPDHQLEKAETTVLTDYSIHIVQNITLIEVLNTRKHKLMKLSL